MSVTIAHAIKSENGTKHGAVGDQLQKSVPDAIGEIRVGSWYKRSGGWNVYLECTDKALAKKAAEYAEQIANSKNYGYSQHSSNKDGRWSGYYQIKEKGIENGIGNFDCSSFVISCYVFAECPKLKPTGYTGNMVRLLMNTGKFTSFTDSEHLNSNKLCTVGGVFVAPGNHTVMVIDAPDSDPDKETDPEPEDPEETETGKNVEVSGSVNVRKDPDQKSKSIFIAKKGMKLGFLDEYQTDSNGNIWLKVNTEKGIGWISAFTNKAKKYTKLV